MKHAVGFNVSIIVSFHFTEIKFVSEFKNINYVNGSSF